MGHSSMLAVFGIVSYGILCCVQFAGSDSLEAGHTGIQAERDPSQIEGETAPVVEEGRADESTATQLAGTDVSARGFLPKWGEDTLSCLGGIGFLITIIALVVGVRALFLTKRQLSRAATASEAAVAAAREANDEARSLYNRYAVSNAANYLDAAKTHATNEDWRLVALRLGDLSRLITQLAVGDGKLEDLADSTRKMEDSFARVAAADLKFVSIKTKWRALHTQLSQVIAKIESPFSPNDRDQFNDY